MLWCFMCNHSTEVSSVATFRVPTYLSPHLWGRGYLRLTSIFLVFMKMLGAVAKAIVIVWASRLWQAWRDGNQWEWEFSPFNVIAVCGFDTINITDLPSAVLRLAVGCFCWRLCFELFLVASAVVVLAVAGLYCFQFTLVLALDFIFATVCPRLHLGCRRFLFAGSCGACQLQFGVSNQDGIAIGRYTV